MVDAVMWEGCESFVGADKRDRATETNLSTERAGRGIEVRHQKNGLNQRHFGNRERLSLTESLGFGAWEAVRSEHVVFQ